MDNYVFRFWVFVNDGPNEGSFLMRQASGLLQPFAIGRTNKLGISVGDIKRKVEENYGKEAAGAILTGCVKNFTSFPMKEHRIGGKSFGIYDFLLLVSQKTIGRFGNMNNVVFLKQETKAADISKYDLSKYDLILREIVK